MNDGSRHFASLPRRLLPYAVRDHVARLTGATLTGFVGGDAEAWIDFAYEDHAFSVNDVWEEYWFFVRDPACPDEVLARVVRHFGAVLR